MFSLGFPLDLGRVCLSSYRRAPWQPVSWRLPPWRRIPSLVLSPGSGSPAARGAVLQGSRPHNSPRPGPCRGPPVGGWSSGLLLQWKKHGLYYASKKTAFCQNSSKSFRYWQVKVSVALFQNCGSRFKPRIAQKARIGFLWMIQLQSMDTFLLLCHKFWVSQGYWSCLPFSAACLYQIDYFVCMKVISKSSYKSNKTSIIHFPNITFKHI